uniref:Integrin beta subunit tail domain-containing protein n=2 Tax=Scylla olivacea TaxID=85551 RepID=A0A0P4WGX5_SCYOL
MLLETCTRERRILGSHCHPLSVLISILRLNSSGLMLFPRMTRVTVWLTAAAVVCGLAQALSELSIPDCSSDSTSCYANRSEPACSGRGVCVCGHCTCNERENYDERVSGPFCECTNFLCDRFNGQLCGGPAHGTCVCNKCVCNPGWTGHDCMCEQSKENCLNPESGVECSGQGACECNQCKCHESQDGRYSGRYCEDCPTCKGHCTSYKECVQCQVFRTGKYTDEQCMTHCTMFNATVVSNLVEEEGDRLCSYFDENDCRFMFVYRFDEDRHPLVYALSTLQCPPPKGTEILHQTSLSHSASSSVSVVMALLSLIPLIR